MGENPSNYSRLSSAISDYTGGKFTPDTREESWQALAKRLEQHKFTPEEFCYWVLHFLDPDNAPANHLLIRKHYVTSLPVWDQFIKYKQSRKKDVDLVVKIQREALRTFQRVYGNSPEHLLEEGSITMNPILRVDYALMQLANHQYKYQIIVDKYMDEAIYQLKGNPEYKPHCWFLQKYMEV
jgi:hypothetical protein